MRHPEPLPHVIGAYLAVVFITLLALFLTLLIIEALEPP